MQQVLLPLQNLTDVIPKSTKAKYYTFKMIIHKTYVRTHSIVTHTHT